MRSKVKIVAVISLIVVITAVFIFRDNRIIGEITGAEWNHLTIGETKYNVNYSLDYTIADKGRYLGKANYNDLSVRLYSVKGDEEGKYIYAFWDWEGFFYVREK